MLTKYCSSPAGVLEKTPWVTAFHLAEEYQRRSDLFDMELHKTLVAAHNTNDIFFRQRYALVLLRADCSLFRNSFFFIIRIVDFLLVFKIGDFAPTGAG